MKIYSLRRSVLAFLVLPLILTGTISVGTALWLSYREISELYDVEMVQQAKFLLILSRHEAEEGEKLNSKMGLDTQKLYTIHEVDTAYRIWFGQTILTESEDAAPIGKTPPAEGFSQTNDDHSPFRVFTISDQDLGITVSVSQRRSLRTDLTTSIFRSLSLPLLLWAMVVSLIIAKGIDWVIRPLRRLSRDVDLRETSNSSPLSASRIPQEIVPLFRALNRLLARQAEGLRREREFTDNAAHELRTPLAALKTRAQVLARKLEPQEDLKEGMNDLLEIINRATAVVDQLLSFTRLQGQVLNLEPVNVSEVLQQSLADIAPQVIARNQTLEADIAPDLIAPGHIGALSVLIRNLVDNASRYTPTGGRIHASLARAQDQAIHLHITDTGPGIPPEDRERVLERFTRLNSDENGSGLGLSIVKWICDAHRATLTLSDHPGGGLAVEISFPSSRSTT